MANWLETVEFGLEDLLGDLNSSGYTTESSCSGHVNLGGVMLPGHIEFTPGAISSRQDVEDVRGIIGQHTSIPFTVRRGVRGRGRVNFVSYVSPRPTPHTCEAKHLLQWHRTCPMPGYSQATPEEIEAVYDIGDLEELERRDELAHQAYLDRYYPKVEEREVKW